jgi:hypothetical protein
VEAVGGCEDAPGEGVTTMQRDKCVVEMVANPLQQQREKKEKRKINNSHALNLIVIT